MSLQDLTLEDIAGGQAYADLDLSPLQRSICRGAMGLQVVDALTPEERMRFFGVEALPGIVPTLIVLVCGVRGGKSFLAACAAIYGVLRADCSRLKRFEVPRFAIIAPRRDVADATMTILTGILSASPLRALIQGEPTSDTIMLRRPDGVLVEIVVVAAAAGAVTVRNRWLVGLIIEEVAQLGIEAQGAVVSAEEMLAGARPRLLPGAQAWLISSPYGPQGLLYDLWKEHFGKPGKTLVVHAPTIAMVPSYPREQLEELTRTDPDVAAREYGAEWLDVENAFLSAKVVDAAIRKEPLEVEPADGELYVASIDPAARGNDFSLVILGRKREDERTKFRVCIARSWQGSKFAPLSLSAVLTEIAALCRPFGIRWLLSDQWSGDALAELAARVGLQLIPQTMTAGERLAAYEQTKNLLSSGALELAPVPALRTDLLGLRKRVVPGGFTIQLPKTADGRHCDYAPALAAAVAGAHWARADAGKSFATRASGVIAQISSIEKGTHASYAEGGITAAAAESSRAKMRAVHDFTGRQDLDAVERSTPRRQ